MTAYQYSPLSPGRNTGRRKTGRKGEGGREKGGREGVERGRREVERKGGREMISQVGNYGIPHKDFKETSFLCTVSATQ